MITDPPPSAYSVVEKSANVGSGGTATQYSNNVVYAQLMLEAGTSNVIRTAEDLGIQSEVPEVPSIVLGAGEVSVLDMASAYSTFRDRGVHHDPVVIERVENSRGEVLWEADASPQQVISEQVADTVTYALERVVDSGTGTRANLTRDTAGKTGTTDDNKDAWFVGYTCEVTTAVWMGYVGREGQPVLPMNNVQGVQVQGGNFPAQMWAEFMNRIDPLLAGDCAFNEVYDFPGETSFADEADDLVVSEAPVEAEVPEAEPDTTAPPATDPPTPDPPVVRVQPAPDPPAPDPPAPDPPAPDPPDPGAGAAPGSGPDP